MNKTTKTILIALGLVALVFLFWYFRYLVACFLIAVIFAAIGRPLKKRLDKIHVKGKHLGNTFTSAITLVTLIGVIFLFFRLFVPIIAAQAASFSQVNIYQIISYYEEPIAHLEHVLIKYGMFEEGTNIQEYLSNELVRFLKLIDYQSLIGNVIFFAGNVFIGIFIVFFVVFFLLKEPQTFTNLVIAMTPEKRISEINHIYKASQYLISRYFIGICCEIALITILLSIGFFIADFPNAFLIAFLCGVLVIIPYIGSIIGGLLGLLITLVSLLGVDPSMSIFPIILKFAGIFVAVKLVDDFFLQPLIYSKSVKAHPLEILFVILIAGEVGGIVGMILAIPVYTLLRIIAKEFFANSRFVKTLTKNI